MSFLSSFLAAIGLAVAPASAPAPAAGPLSRVSEDNHWHAFSAVPLAPEANQVRIEQRVIWRIGPMTGLARDQLMAMAPMEVPSQARLRERKSDKCVPMALIAGGEAQQGSRLLLFLRDRRLLAADLEKTCSARDFYSGFYVDKPAPDGKLCTGRDRILSRSGARCSISAFRLLIPEG